MPTVGHMADFVLLIFTPTRRRAGRRGGGGYTYSTMTVIMPNSWLHVRFCLADFWPLIFNQQGRREGVGSGGGGGSYVHSTLTVIRAKPVSAGNMCNTGHVNGP